MPTRATFLTATAATAASSLVPFARASAADQGTIFVMLYLQGGIDGFNTVVPLAQYGQYHDRRTNSNGSIAVSESAIAATGTAFDADPATPAARATQFAFHPAMSGLRRLYGRGKVATLFGLGILPGSAVSGDPDRLSHETGMVDWSTATTCRQTDGPPGWMGSAVNHVASSSNELPARLSVAGELPVLFRGSNDPALVVSSPLEDFTYQLVGGTPAAITMQGIDALGSAGPAARFAAGVASDALTYVGRIATYARGGPPADYASIAQPGYDAASGRSDLSLQLEQIARLIAKAAPVRAYWATQMGYDTHRAQNDTHPALVADLSNSVYQFYSWLSAHGVSRRVVLVTYSDFGRRAAVNASLGTDHGSANVAFAIGDRVRGGVYGEYPSLALSALDASGNAAVPFDFRNAIAEIVVNLGVDPALILPQPYVKKTLGFLTS